MSSYTDLIERLQAGPAYPSTADKLAKFLAHRPTPALLVQLFEAGCPEPDPFYTKGTEQ